MKISSVLKAFIIVSAISLAACGGGGGGGGAAPNVNPPPPPPPTGPANPVVYGGTPDASGVFNLYLADVDNPGTAVQLNPTLPPGAAIRFFDPSPDLTRVVYSSDENTIDKVELFVVELANPGVSILLSTTATPANTDVQEFAFSHDGTRLVYASDQDTVGVREIYLVNFANPGVTTKINGPMPPSGDVATGFEFSPDDTQIIYPADVDINATFELFRVDVGLPGVATKVNSPFAAFSNLRTGHGYSPDGNWIIYAADQDLDGVGELFVVDNSNLGTSIKVHADYGVDRDVCSWKFSPNSMKIAYCADQDTDGILELYSVDVASLGISTKLNPPLVSGGAVQSGAFQFSGDSTFIAYVADQDTDNLRELYRVELSAAGVAQKLNSPLIPAGDVRNDFEIRADDLAIAYKADQDIDANVHLYEVNFSDPGVSTRVHPALAGDDVLTFRYFADGLRLALIAEQDSNDVSELYMVDVVNFGVTTKLSSPLAAGGQISNIVIPAR